MNSSTEGKSMNTLRSKFIQHHLKLLNQHHPSFLYQNLFQGLDIQYAYFSMTDVSCYDLLSSTNKPITNSQIIIKGVDFLMKPLRSTQDIIYKTSEDPTILALKITDNLNTFGYLYYIDFKCPTIKNYPLMLSYESMVNFLLKAKNNEENINTGQTCVLLYILADYLVGRNHAMLLLDISSSPTNEEMRNISKLFDSLSLFSCIHGYTTKNVLPTNNWAINDMLIQLKHLEAENKELVDQCEKNQHVINSLNRELKELIPTLKNIMDKKNKLESGYNDLMHYKTALEVNYQYSQRQRKELYIEKEALEKKHHDDEFHMKILKNQLLEKEKCTNSLLQVYDELKLESSNQLIELDKLRPLINIYEDRIKYTKTLVDEYENLNAKYLNQIVELERLKELVLTYEDKEKRTKSALEQYDKLKLENLNQMEELERSKQLIKVYEEKIKYSSTHSDEFIKTLIKKYNEEKNDLKGRHRRSLDKIRLLESQIKQLSSETMVLKNAIADHNKTNVDQNKDYNKLNVERELRHQLLNNQKEMSHKYSILNNQLNRQHQFINQLYQNIMDLKNASYKENHMYMDELNNKTQACQITNHQNKKSISTETYAEREKEYKSKVESLKNELEKKEKEINHLKNNLTKSIEWNKRQTNVINNERTVLLQWIELIRAKWNESMTYYVNKQHQDHNMNVLLKDVDGDDNEDESQLPTIIEFPDYALPESLSKQVSVYLLNQNPSND
ncbi:unnamed protein product [Cunninghamella blakesleeana]